MALNSSKSSVGPPDFSEPWNFSDRPVRCGRLCLRCRFTSQFKEKNLCEAPLPEKRASKIEELQLIIYPTKSGKLETCYNLIPRRAR